MSNTGIIAAIVALLAGAVSAREWKPGTPGGGTFPGGTLPGGGTLREWTEKPTGMTIVNVDPLTPGPTPAAPIPVPAVPTPAAPTPVRNASTGWRWFTPGGVIESRDPTQEERDNGLGCPEVPGIWDMSKNSLDQWRYCANPGCPSNKSQTEPNGEVLPATPAVLQQEVDKATGQVSYYCPVCGNRTI